MKITDAVFAADDTYFRIETDEGGRYYFSKGSFWDVMPFNWYAKELSAELATLLLKAIDKYEHSKAVKDYISKSLTSGEGKGAQDQESIMNNIKDTLQEIVHYYDVTRQAGHTTAMLDGALHTENSVVIASTFDHARTLAKENPGQEVLSLGNIPNQLRGRHQPIAFDNAAIRQLCATSAHRIEELESSISKLMADNAGHVHIEMRQVDRIIELTALLSVAESKLATIKRTIE